MSAENIIGLLYDMCRLCLERNGHHSIFAKHDLTLVIAECAGVQVEAGDGLPDTVCEVCMERLGMCRAFRRVAAHSNARLRVLQAKARTASVSESEYEPMIPEIVMGASDSNLSEEETPQPVAVSQGPREHSQENRSAELSRIVISSDLFKSRTEAENCSDESPKIVIRSDLFESNAEAEFAVEPERKPLKRWRKIQNSFSKPDESDKERNPKRKRSSIHRSKETDNTNISNPQSNEKKAKRRRIKADCAQPQEDKTKTAGDVVFKKHASTKPEELEEDLICKTCDKEFSTPKKLYLHQRSHVKRYHCPICEKGFSSNGDLSKHTRIHTGERPYMCDICGKSFAQNVSLRNHRNVHVKMEFDMDKKKDVTKPKTVAANNSEDNNAYESSETVALFSDPTKTNGQKQTFKITENNTKLHAGFGTKELDEGTSSKTVPGDSSDSKKTVLSDTVNRNVDNDAIESDTMGTDDRGEVYSNANANANLAINEDLDVNIIESTYFCSEDKNKIDEPVTIEASKKRARKNKKSFECDICNKRFTHEKKLQSHKIKHDNETVVDSVRAVADSTNAECVIPETNDLFGSDNSNDSNDKHSQEPYKDGPKLNESCEVINGVNSADCKGDNAGPASTSNSKQYRCGTCNKTFVEEKKFERHKDRHEKRELPQLKISKNTSTCL